jgi:pimeloyl-ACP methyl ester carboxylesterase
MSWHPGSAVTRPPPTAGPFDFASLTGDVLALIDRLWRQWSPGLTLYPALRAELHKDLRASMPAPLKYYRQMMRPGMLGVLRRLSQPITVPLLQLHGADDGGIVPPQVDDRHRFAAPASVTSCTSRPPKRSRNASRHGPRSGSLAPRARPPGWAARGGR